ncbi:hypothetical protein SAMN06272755_3246 [Picosynechococcus sp. OG1]|nr:hypothetical protein SAMN06272755_3246 [Picosynechococcus sp. OG1]SMQ86380.1 hypothetical protein SAMN06272774_3120 [Synechococcus sp. 7002]
MQAIESKTTIHNDMVTLQREYHTVLISEAVTSKIKVLDLVASN